MKLKIELVPSSTWFTNLRSLLPRSVWDKYRKECYKNANYRCEICGGKGSKWPVECHEIWEYDDINHIQTLKGLIALCPACHEVKHFGLATIRGRDRIALSHLMKVNNIDRQEAINHIHEASQLHQERSRWEYDIIIDSYIPEFNRI